MSNEDTTHEYSQLIVDITTLTYLFLGPEPQAGGLYVPQLLPDYDPNLFAFKKNMLAQQDLFDTDNKLIGPWDVQSALRPGTLVVVEATLVVYNFCGENPATVHLSFSPVFV